MSTFCSTCARKEDTDTIADTSTNCSAVCGAMSTLRLLGNANVELPAHLHQLVLQLRHKNVKRRHDERVADDLFHGATLVPFLRPDLEEPVRPRPGGLFLVKAGELRLGCGQVLDRGRTVQLVLPHPGPGHLRALRAVVPLVSAMSGALAPSSPARV